MKIPVIIPIIVITVLMLGGCDNGESRSRSSYNLTIDAQKHITERLNAAKRLSASDRVRVLRVMEGRLKEHWNARTLETFAILGEIGDASTLAYLESPEILAMIRKQEGEMYVAYDAAKTRIIDRINEQQKPRP